MAAEKGGEEESLDFSPESSGLWLTQPHLTPSPALLGNTQIAHTQPHLPGSTSTTPDNPTGPQSATHHHPPRASAFQTAETGSPGFHLLQLRHNQQGFCQMCSLPKRKYRCAHVVTFHSDCGLQSDHVTLRPEPSRHQCCPHKDPSDHSLSSPPTLSPSSTQ